MPKIVLTSRFPLVEEQERKSASETVQPNALCILLELLSNESNSTLIAIDAQSADHSHGFVGKIAVMSERLSGVYIRDMYFDKLEVAAHQGISQANTSMGQSPRIDNHIADLASCFVYAINDGAFVIRLKVLHLYAEFAALLDCCVLDICQGRAAIDVRLPGSQKIEVWAIDQENSLGHDAE